MNIRTAGMEDYAFLSENDRHIRPEELRRVLSQGRVLLLRQGGERAGWLRWGLFWDNTPFMNMLYVLEEYRGQGCGRRLAACWEERMREDGFDLVMTSTRSDEEAQHFYRGLGYTDCGALLLPGEPLELIFRKEIRL